MKDINWIIKITNVKVLRRIWIQKEDQEIRKRKQRNIRSNEYNLRLVISNGCTSTAVGQAFLN